MDVRVLLRDLARSVLQAARLITFFPESENLQGFIHHAHWTVFFLEDRIPFGVEGCVAVHHQGNLLITIKEGGLNSQ